MLDPTAVTGRGLLLISAVSDRWGVEPSPDGKVVWFELLADSDDLTEVSVALLQGHERVDVTLTIPREDAELVRDFAHAVDAADRLSRTGLLLVGPAPVDLSDARRGYLRRILLQLGG